MCVEATFRDASVLGFYPFIVRDATATLTKEAHAASIATMEFLGYSATVAEVEEAIKAL